MKIKGFRIYRLKCIKKVKNHKGKIECQKILKIHIKNNPAPMINILFKTHQ